MSTRRFAALALLFAVACASGPGRPPGATQPQVGVQLLGGAPFFGSTRTAPVTLEVSVGNTGSVPVNVRRIEITSPGMVQYGIYPTERFFNDQIAPGEARAFALSATAVAASTRIADAEPLTVRVAVELESGGKRWRELYLSRLAQ